MATAVQYTTTSTVLVGPAGTCLVVDPAVTVAEVAALAAELGRRRLRPVAGWATHPHWDHLLWSAELGEVPRYATATAAAVAERDRAAITDAVCSEAAGHDLTLVGRLTALAGALVPWDGPAVQVIEHAAHAAGHGALFLPDAGTLLAGDMCSDIEIPLLDTASADPVGEYRAGLAALAGLHVRLVVPGHGHPGDGGEFRRRVAADLRYLDALERGASSAAEDERIGTGWLRAEHDRQFAVLNG